MIEKTAPHKLRRGKEPLGRSLSDILLKAGYQNKAVPLTAQSKASAANVQCHPVQSMHSEDDVTETQEKSGNVKMIGLTLKRGREQKNLTLARISSDLCLKTSLLSSIEAGDWANLPHEVYVRGYIRRYADLLGIQSEITPYLKERESQENSVNPKGWTGRLPNRKLLPFLRNRKAPSAMLLYAGAIIVMLGFFFVMGEKRQGAERSKLENAVRVSSSIAEIDAKKNIPDLIDTKKLMITCHERTWISVIIDGTEKKEFTLKPQEVVILNAKERFDLLVGNAGGVRLLLDGKDTSFSGENGQVKRVTLS